MKSKLLSITFCLKFLGLTGALLLLLTSCLCKKEKDHKKTSPEKSACTQETSSTAQAPNDPALQTNEAFYKEITRILKTQYADPSTLASQKTNQAVIDGILNSLNGSAFILNSEPNSNSSTQKIDAINSLSILESNIAYIRLNRIETDTAHQLDNEIQKLIKENQIKGLILDLRFAQSTQYSAVPPVASIFLSQQKPIFSIQRASHSQTYQTSPNPNPIDLPLVILINHETKGAPETLAAVLKDQERALLIGNAETAGQIFETSDIKLSNGQILRLATGKICLSKAGDFFLKKVQPDVKVDFNEKTEKELFNQPFKPPELQSDARFYSEAILTGRELAPPITKNKKKMPSRPSSKDDFVLLRAMDLLKTIQVLGLSSPTQAVTPKTPPTS